MRSSRSGILGGDRVNLKLIIQRMDRCQQWLQLLQDCMPFWGAEHRCRTGDVERVQLKAQFSQAFTAGIHGDKHNSPYDADPIGQFATSPQRPGNRIWSVRRPLEAVAVTSRVRGGHRAQTGLPPFAACHCCTDSRSPQSIHQLIFQMDSLVYPDELFIQQLPCFGQGPAGIGCRKQ
jgi:hypothetical protein